EPPLPAARVSVHECDAVTDAGGLSASQRRRLSRLAQMALVSARRSHCPDPAQRLAVAIGTGMGFLGAAGAFLENYISKEEREPMPSQFPASVHNAAASQVAMDMRAQAMNSAPTAGEISFECALWQGMSQLVNGEADCALAGAVDELNKYLLGIGQRWGMWNERTRPDEGAVVASLARPRLLASRSPWTAYARVGAECSSTLSRCEAEKRYAACNPKPIPNPESSLAAAGGGGTLPAQLDTVQPGRAGLPDSDRTGCEDPAIAALRTLCLPRNGDQSTCRSDIRRWS